MTVSFELNSSHWTCFATVLPIVLDAAVKSVLVLATAGVAVCFMRKCSAAARHLVWFLGVASLTFLPVLSLALPGWHILPRWLNVPNAPPPEQRAAPATEALSPPSSPQPPVNAVAPAEARREPREFQSTPVSSGERAEFTPPTPSGVASPPPQHGPFNLLPFVLPLWLAGAALALVPTALGLFSLWRLERGSRREKASSWLELLRQLVDRLNLKRAVALLKTNRRRMPMTWGILRPKLLLPEESQEWSAERRNVVLLHELAHAKRWDYLTNLITQLVCALYWFNPLVWFAARQMIAERERACDDIVLRHGARPADYAEQILQIAAGLRVDRAAIYGGIAMARPTNLEGRLRAILDSGRNRAALTRFIVLAAMILLVVIVVPLAMLKAGPAADTASETQTEVVVWEAIVDGATFESLHSGPGPVEKTNIYRAEMLDAARVLSTLRSAQRDGGLLEFDEHMDWFKSRDPRFGGQQILTLMYSRQRPEAPGVSAQNVLVNCNRFQASEHLATLDLTITAYAQFERLQPGTNDFMSAESKPANHPVNWKGNLEAGRVICVSAELDGNFDRELHHVVFVQAVAAPRDLAAYLRGIASTALWLANGPEGALQIGREAKAWDEKAMVSEAAATTSVSPLSGSGIRIAAIGQPGRWPHRWWNTDGNRIQANPAWQQYAGGANLAVAFQDSALEGSVCRTLRTPDDPQLSIVVNSTGSNEFPPADSVFYFSSSPEKLQKYLDDGGRIDLVIQRGVGPWQEIGTIREGETVEAGGGRFKLDKVEDRPGMRGSILLDGHYDYDTAFDIAMVAVDKQGRRTPVGSRGGVGLFYRRDGRRIYCFATIAKEEVAHFAILKRPVKEFVFTNLPTTPIAPTGTQTNAAGASRENTASNASFQSYPAANPNSSPVTEAESAQKGNLEELKRFLTSPPPLEYVLYYLTNGPSSEFRPLNPSTRQPAVVMEREWPMSIYEGSWCNGNFWTRRLEPGSTSPYGPVSGAFVGRSGDTYWNVVGSTVFKGTVREHDQEFPGQVKFARSFGEEQFLLIQSLGIYVAKPGAFQFDGNRFTVDRGGGSKAHGELLVTNAWVTGIRVELPSFAFYSTFEFTYDRNRDQLPWFFPSEITQKVHRKTGGFRSEGYHAVFLKMQIADRELSPDRFLSDGIVVPAGATNLLAGLPSPNPMYFLVGPDGKLTQTNSEVFFPGRGGGASFESVGDAKAGLTNARPFTVKGRVTDPQGNGIAGVTITAHCGMGTLFPTGETDTDATGHYTLHFREGMKGFDESSGQWRVTVQAATISPRKAGWFETNLYRGGDLLMADKLPAPDENVGWKLDPAKVVLPSRLYELNFVMQPAARIVGQLSDELERPMARTKIWIDGPLPPASSVLAETETDDEGRFHFEDVPTGYFWLFNIASAAGMTTRFESPGELSLYLRVRESRGGKVLGPIAPPGETIR